MKLISLRDASCELATPTSFDSLTEERVSLQWVWKTQSNQRPFRLFCFRPNIVASDILFHIFPSFPSIAFKSPRTIVCVDSCCVTVKFFVKPLNVLVSCCWSGCLNCGKFPCGFLINADKRIYQLARDDSTRCLRTCNESDAFNTSLSRAKQNLSDISPFLRKSCRLLSLTSCKDVVTECCGFHMAKYAMLDRRWAFERWMCPVQMKVGWRSQCFRTFTTLSAPSSTPSPLSLWRRQHAAEN